MVYRISGEARVCTVGAKFAILSKPGLDGTIFVQPTSLVCASVTEPLPSLVENLRHNDVCSFEAEAQAERNGSKWRAVDGTVKVVRQAETVNSEGTITKLDETNGQYGFIRSSVGDVFFNASSVRPPTKSIATMFKTGQLVKFTAVNCNNQSMHRTSNAVQLRAVMVCARNYREPNPTSIIGQRPKKPLTISASEPMIKTEPPRENAWLKRSTENPPPQPQVYNVWTGKSLLTTNEQEESKAPQPARQATGSVVSSERSTLNSPLSSCGQTDSSENIDNTATTTTASHRVSPLFDGQRIGTPLLYTGNKNCQPDSTPDDSAARPLDRLIGDTALPNGSVLEQSVNNNNSTLSLVQNQWIDEDKHIEELIELASKSILEDSNEDVFKKDNQLDLFNKIWEQRAPSPVPTTGSNSLLPTMESIWAPSDKDPLLVRVQQSAPPVSNHRTHFTFDLPQA